MNAFSLPNNPGSDQRPYNSRLPQISVHHMGRTIAIGFDKITLLEGEGNYTYVYTRMGTKYLVCRTLKSLAFQLEGNFLRVHKSFLVNSDLVVGCAVDGRALRMICGNEAVVSRRKTKEIIEIFGQRISA
jgi:two-component system LytT family response regulator|uniref:LytR/AlgR family response regulator transcription factor n=1 Tax=Dyadobacter sp. MSC1_007 TaxID=2909264 RepID=UPI00202F1842|nr:LytTR family DNA-binding domain-containing protein [Dyadobacter sp. MSC1_007]